jgi:serine/threonine protein kinase
VKSYQVPAPPTPTTPQKNAPTSTPQQKQQQQQQHVSPSSSPVSGDSRSMPKYVGDYLLLKTIGQGTFGKVKVGEHIVTQQQVAIKVIEKANVKTHKQRNSVQREVRLMKLLHHPHIVEVMDIIENHDHIYIIMEYASGGELFDYIVSHGMVKEKEARVFFRQILSAVDYCHKNSIIHRDLKPEVKCDRIVLTPTLDANISFHTIESVARCQQEYQNH